MKYVLLIVLTIVFVAMVGPELYGAFVAPLERTSEVLHVGTSKH